MIGGAVVVDGHPAASQCVLALSEDMQRLLGAAVTGDDGRYAIDLPADTPVALVAKVHGPVLAVAVRQTHFAASHDFVFDSTGEDFATIRGVVVPPKGVHPPSVELSITPAHLRGVPAGVEKFFLRREAGVVDAAFFEMQLHAPKFAFALRVQRGRYRIYAGRINYGRPMTTAPTPPNVIAERIEADGESAPLPGERFGGFELDVDRDRSIRLLLSILPDDQLSPAGG